MHPKVVISGTFHKGLQELKLLCRELESTGCRLLSPLSLEFEEPTAPVVKTSSELEFTVAELEKYHLRAINEADFVWLHAPEGYVGISASYELGFARALQKPIFCSQEPNDEMLRTQVKYVPSVFSALELISSA